MIEEFITELKNSSYYERMFRDHNVIMIYVGGSRIINITDERSDYDLVVVTDNSTSDYEPDEFFTYKDLKVHWYYRSLSQFIEKCDNPRTIGCFNGVLFANLTDEVIIYEGSKYKRIIDYLKSVRDRIGKVSTYLLLNSKKQLVESILNAGEVLEEHYTKYLYYLCYASYYIMGEEPNKDFLATIKRIRWQPVSDKYKKLIVERIGYLDAYVSQNSFDISGTINYLDTNLDYLIKSIG